MLQKTRVTEGITVAVVAYEFNISPEELRRRSQPWVTARTVSAGIMFDAGHTSDSICRALNCNFREMSWYVQKFFEVRDSERHAATREKVEQVKRKLFNVEG